MSEEEYMEECERKYIERHTTHIKGYTEEYVNNLQQKVEQLEKENKELKQPQVFIDCENMEERYGRDLYEDYLKEKIEQLENIRKEAIEFVKEHARIDDEYPAYIEMLLEEKQDLLNILNKGE